MAADDSNSKYEPDIPIIADAVVVVAENEDYGADNIENPPATNPSHVPSSSSTAIVPIGGNFSPIPQHTTTTTLATNNTTTVAKFSGGTSNATMIYQMGRNSTGLKCPHCSRQTVTVVRDMIGVGTVIAIVALAILFWPLCWLPLCVPCEFVHLHFISLETVAMLFWLSSRLLKSYHFAFFVGNSM